MRTAGIIGGMGPETTAKFYLDVIFNAYENNKLQRPPMLIWNVPLLYRIEDQLLRNAKGISAYLPYLTAAAHNLEQGGADFIVIPCNTVHVLLPQIRNAVSIPVLSIIEETRQFLKKKKLKNVGVLATSLALHQRLYHNCLESIGVEMTQPDGADQRQLDAIISRLVKKQHAEREKAALLNIIRKLGKNADAVLLACTDLQLIVEKNEMPLPVYDTMDLLVDATVRELLR